MFSATDGICLCGAGTYYRPVEANCGACASDYYADLSTRTCVKCSNGCQTCLDSTTCLSCDPADIFDPSTNSCLCAPNNFLQITCSTSTCSDGYYPDMNNVCQQCSFAC